MVFYTAGRDLPEKVYLPSLSLLLVILEHGISDFEM